jgi:S-DNA-T family DNA segregation ATPase FtsK/SpoIIIE
MLIIHRNSLEEDIIDVLASLVLILIMTNLDLSNYKFPTNTGGITINQEELEENKTNCYYWQLPEQHNKKAISWTITLYEIVPEAGIRISKIKRWHYTTFRIRMVHVSIPGKER